MKRHITLFITLIATTLLTAQTAWTEKTAHQWLKNTAWQHGFNAMPDKTTDIVEFARQYDLNTPMWDSVFTWLAGHDLSTMPTGTYAIADTIIATIVDSPTRPAERCLIESHRRKICLQYTISGTELLRVMHAADTYVIARYNKNKDVTHHDLRDDARPLTRKSNSKTFFVFFPNDIHQSTISPNGHNARIRKIIIKIPYTP